MTLEKKKKKNSLQAHLMRLIYYNNLITKWINSWSQG